MSKTTISGQIVDLVQGAIYPGTLEISAGKISRVIAEPTASQVYLLPGLVDAHIHIESSMLVPTEFARLAVIHGTVATVSDPHEIANVMGNSGINYLLDNSRLTPFKFHFGVPSAVPATRFELSGAKIGAAEVDAWLASGKLQFLGEVMNVPGVLTADPELTAKIAAARRRNLPIDGHAPQLTATALSRYIQAGILTDHETATYESACEKIQLGMHIQIRQGSAAKDFDALHPLLGSHPEFCMFCSDDRHPDALAAGHIDTLVRKALQLGYHPLNVLRCASLNPIRHYQLNMGLLQPGDPADLLVVDNLYDFRILQTYIEGQLVAESGHTLLASVPISPINNFHAGFKKAEDFAIAAPPSSLINVMEITDGQLLTGWSQVEPLISEGQVQSDPARDIIKLFVINRYQDSAPAIGFVKNFGISAGAVASSVAHDSHNIIVAGVSDQAIATAVNLVIENQGGLAVVGEAFQEILPLPVAGLMSDQEGLTVARQYSVLLESVKRLGCPLHDPFMTLSFLSLPVIPALKLTAQGLVDVEKFANVDLFV